MDGGITRQSEQYGIFEDRPRAKREASEVPESVVREYTRGPQVGAGMLNPRGIRRQHFAGYEGPAVPESYWYDDEAAERHRYHDEEFGLNREPPEDEDPGFPEMEPGAPHGRPLPFGTPIYNPRSSPYDNITGRRLGFNRRVADDGAAPAVMGGQLFTHMFVPGQRVGLPYNGQVIPGIVTHLHPDSQVGVRWHDGQHSKEDPVDIQPL